MSFLFNLCTSSNCSPIGPLKKEEISVNKEQEREMERVEDEVVNDDENKSGQWG